MELCSSRGPTPFVPTRLFGGKGDGWASESFIAVYDCREIGVHACNSWSGERPSRVRVVKVTVR